jgi:hypothetical protein
MIESVYTMLKIHTLIAYKNLLNWYAARQQNYLTVITNNIDRLIKISRLLHTTTDHPSFFK